MNISIATDFNGSTGCPKNSLKAIAEAGFTHLHWCHQWCTDFLYSKYEIQQIKAWLKEFGLKLLDIHGSDGAEKRWYSPMEYERKAGAELVLNRARMLRELDGEGVLMMHVPRSGINVTSGKPEDESYVDALFRSMDEIAPELEKLQVVIAAENMPNDNFNTIRLLTERYPANLVGITYDSGHGNFGTAQGLHFMEQFKGRLQALHLHDNDGSGDQHQPPFYGTIDWDRLTTLIATSSYTRCASFELSMKNTPFFDKTVTGPQGPEMVKRFLADSYTRCKKVTAMLEAKRSSK